ncbi:hypothetical protein [Campylobacter aviculae]|uniref:Transmembrane protein n=1 Tax=Campylobacter aviculae TaxID=2510190 RepID=A0A4V6DXL5_9BACT|nr:hypothetical protein [Campylobacter aviculae]TKX32292.1 hypothetical protein CQA76_04215 [Campylobacter aviculae]
MKNKIEIVHFEKLIYVQKNGRFEEDRLFEEIIKECDIKNPFEYQIAFLKQDEIYHCFLSRVENLPKCLACFPKAFIFKPLFKNNLIEKNNFCFLELYLDEVYLCFYEQDNFKAFKKFKYEKDMELFLEKTHILELLQYYESEIVISFENNDLIKELKNKAIACKILEQNENKLAELSVPFLDKNTNFIKISKKIFPYYIKLVFLFLLSFLSLSGILIFTNFLNYQENKNLQTQSKISQDKLYRLEKEKNIILEKKLKDLNSTLYNKKTLLDQNFNQLDEIIKNFKPNKDRILILKNIFIWLNQNSLGISSLKLKNYNIIIQFNNQENYLDALRNLKSDFKLISKNDTLYQIILELDHG